MTDVPDRHSHWLTGQKHRFSLGLRDHLPGLLLSTHRMSWGGGGAPHTWVHVAAAPVFLHTPVAMHSISMMALHGDTLIYCTQDANPVGFMDSDWERGAISK